MKFESRAIGGQVAKWQDSYYTKQYNYDKFTIINTFRTLQCFLTFLIYENRKPKLSRKLDDESTILANCAMLFTHEAIASSTINEKLLFLVKAIVATLNIVKNKIHLCK